MKKLLAALAVTGAFAVGSSAQLIENEDYFCLVVNAEPFCDVANNEGNVVPCTGVEMDCTTCKTSEVMTFCAPALGFVCLTPEDPENKPDANCGLLWDGDWVVDASSPTGFRCDKTIQVVGEICGVIQKDCRTGL